MLPALPGTVRKLLNSIRDAGGYAWVVGGALRDMLLDSDPFDWDIATTLTPEELLALFPYARLIGGTCGTVLVKWNNVGFEITPCRTENGYTDSRHPDRVEFVPNIFTDLARRDFTINAMAFDGQMLLDPFGGQQDLKRRQIRCVGEPAQRFKEDTLRILRMLRFSAQLGFGVEDATMHAATRAMGNVNTLNRERVRGEVNRILLGRSPQILGSLVAAGGLVRYGFHFAPNLRPLATVPDLPLCRWWAFAAMCGVEVRAMGEAFGFSRRFIAELSEMTELYRKGPAANDMAMKYKLRASELDYEAVSNTFAAISPAFAAEPAMFAGIRMRREPYRIPDLVVNGSDLLEEGLDGKTCGQMLDSLLNVVIQNPTLNKRDVLMGIVRGLCDMM